MAACKVTAHCIMSSYHILIDLPEAMHKDRNWCLLLTCNISLSQIISFIVHASHLFNIFVNSVHYHSDVQIYVAWFSFLKLITKKTYLISAQQTTFRGSSTNQSLFLIFYSHLFLSDRNKIKQRCCCKSKTNNYSSVKTKNRFQKHLYIQFQTLLEKIFKAQSSSNCFPD